jgi:repressor LexA
VERAELPKRQGEALDIVREFTAEHHSAPTIREVARHLGISSSRGAENHLRALVKKGLLEHVAHSSRAYRLPPAPVDAPTSKSSSKSRDDAGVVPDGLVRLPLVGNVPAGVPSEDERSDLGHVVLPVKVSSRAFAFRVTGDSMRDAHIIDGDLAIADPAVQPDDRAVVVAMVDGRYTMKVLRRNPAGDWWLEAANEEYPPILPRLEGDHVAAPVIALFRPGIGKRPRSQPW